MAVSSAPPAAWTARATPKSLTTACPRCEQDIRRLDVPVYDVVAVGVGQGIGHFAGDPHRLLDRERTLGDQQIPEGLTRGERHHVVEAATSFAGVVQGENVRVLQGGCDLDLAIESIPADRGRQLRLEDLDRDIPIMAKIPCAKHDRHSATTDLLHNVKSIGERSPEPVEKILHGIPVWRYLVRDEACKLMLATGFELRQTQRGARARPRRMPASLRYGLYGSYGYAGRWIVPVRNVISPSRVSVVLKLLEPIVPFVNPISPSRVDVAFTRLSPTEPFVNPSSPSRVVFVLTRSSPIRAVRELDLAQSGRVRADAPVPDRPVRVLNVTEPGRGRVHALVADRAGRVADVAEAGGRGVHTLLGEARGREAQQEERRQKDGRAKRRSPGSERMHSHLCLRKSGRGKSPQLVR